MQRLVHRHRLLERSSLPNIKSISPTWNLQTGKLLHEFADNFSSVESFVISPNGKILICGNYDGSIKLWNLEQGKLLHTSRNGSSSVLGLALSPDGKTLASSNEDSTIHIWQIN
ncbi:WD40 repeat domain-containing protein [Nostoc sp.]|uniref:WD40 repeat domain-containing protein n=1 Tax=Nostoc sp. TaxID=1180 RepID=UPI002FFC1F29